MLGRRTSPLAVSPVLSWKLSTYEQADLTLPEEPGFLELLVGRGVEDISESRRWEEKLFGGVVSFKYGRENAS